MDTRFFYGDWHRVLIFDEDLRKFVRNNLKITDRLLINGEIFYHKIELKDGRAATQGNILPRRIEKFDRFMKDDQKDPENAQATVEQ